MPLPSREKLTYPPRQRTSRSSLIILLIFAIAIVGTVSFGLYIAFFTDEREAAVDSVSTETAEVFETAAAGSTATAAAVGTQRAAPGTPAASADNLAGHPVITATAPAGNAEQIRELTSQGGSADIAAGPAQSMSDDATPAAAALECPESCLFRAPDEDTTRQTLDAAGMPVTYAAGGTLWAGGSSEAVTSLVTAGIAITTIQPNLDTVALYVLRATAGAEANLASQAEAIGELVDANGRIAIVRVAQVPPTVWGTLEAGFAIEKLPPAVQAPADTGERESLPPVPEDPWPLAAGVSQDELSTTIGDLQAMSSTDGSGIGTRHYLTPGNVMAGEYLYQRFAAYGVPVWYEDFVTTDGRLVVNVVAEIPGRDPSQPFLVLGHFDSINDFAIDQSEAPGADDNASGIAGMLEIARVLSGYDLAYPVRFLATNVEEVGIQGVAAFTEQLAAEGDTIIGAYNLDAIGSYAHGSQLVLNADGASVWLQDLLIRMNDSYGLGQSLIVRQNPGIVADDNTLRAAGVPTVLVARELFGWSDILHTAADTVPTLDLANVQSGTQLVLLGMIVLAGYE